MIQQMRQRLDKSRETERREVVDDMQYRTEIN